VAIVVLTVSFISYTLAAGNLANAINWENLCKIKAVTDRILQTCTQQNV